MTALSKISGVLGLTFVICLVPSALAQRGDPIRDCARHASVSTDAPVGDISVTGGGNTYRWQARVGRNRLVSGTCEANGRGVIVRFERNEDQGSGGFPGGGLPGGGAAVYPQVKVDTSGQGSFRSGNQSSARITRGLVNTRDMPSVGMRGGDFSITFYGEVQNSPNEREFTMRITGSDRGNAQGTAQVRLNGDRNEVESITVNGRLGRDNFEGSFNRK